ncbi:unnamed protein product [Echinostoma caproni]|uniref:Tektin n=1 Tax=Echinostoma caproni TaxID=27848 RepID=A0A183ANW7_9TREM|nr:unnamed protein product [Echinostoma caproni]
MLVFSSPTVVRHRSQVVKPDLPYSDSRIEALSTANYALRTRLGELQRLQIEREITLRKARQMVDKLISKQQTQAELIKNNTDRLQEFGDHSWPLSPLRPVIVGDYAEKPIDTTSTQWTQYAEPMVHHVPHAEQRRDSDSLSDEADPKSIEDWVDRPRSTNRAHWMDRVQQMDSQVVSTHQILDRLRDDYAELARSVSRIEQKTREAANSVNTMMEYRAQSRNPEISRKSYSPETVYGQWIDPAVASKLQRAR